MSNVVQHIIAAAAPTPAPLPMFSRPEDFRHRKLEIQLVLSLVKGYLDAAMTDAAYNTNALDLPEALRTIDASLFDLSGDLCGTLELAALAAEDASGEGAS